MKKAIELSSHSLPPQREKKRNKISETLEAIPDKELVLPGHNKATCWKILNERVFNTGLFILRFKQIKATVGANSDRYRILDGILNSVSYRKADRQISLPLNKILESRKELKKLSEELLSVAKEKQRRKEIPAGLKNFPGDASIYCTPPDEKGGKKKKPKHRNIEKKLGRPCDKDVVPKKILETREELAAYIVELNARHSEGPNTHTAPENEKKSIHEIANIHENLTKQGDILWGKTSGSGKLFSDKFVATLKKDWRKRERHQGL